MDDAERERLLDRLSRSSATVGAKIPETVEIQGTEVNLAELIIETRRVKGIPPEHEDTVADARTALQAERERKLDRLETEDLMLAEGEVLADAIVGIDRAHNALANLRSPSYAEQHQRTSVEDQRRWVEYLDQIVDL